MWSGPVGLGAMRQRMVTPPLSVKSANRDDPVAETPRRSDDLELVALGLAQERGADGRADRHLPADGIGLVRAHHRVRRLDAVVLDDDGGAEPDAALVRAPLDDLDVAQELLDGLDPTLQEGLLAARLLVLRVLLEVAQLAGGLDASHDSRPRHGRQLTELGAECGEAGFGEASRRPDGVPALRRRRAVGGGARAAQHAFGAQDAGGPARRRAAGRGPRRRGTALGRGRGADRLGGGEPAAGAPGPAPAPPPLFPRPPRSPPTSPAAGRARRAS